MVSLVTGAGGFAGRHLCRLLRSQAQDVHALLPPLGETLPVEGAQETFRADLLDFPALCAVFEKSRPDLVYHLAALASPEQSWTSRRKTHETNYFGTLNVLEAVLACGLRPRIVLVGSASVYGSVPQDRQPVNEEAPLLPRDPYGVSKAAAELLGRQYWMAHRLDIVLLRPFNHTGPGQGPGFVCPDFARQIAQIEAGLLPPLIRVGNLAAERDFTDVRDMAEAYLLAARHCAPGEPYNVGSGQAWSIRSVLDRLLELARLPISVEIDPARMRPLDTPRFVCDATRFRQATGWSPRFDFFQQTLPALLEGWRERIKG